VIRTNLTRELAAEPDAPFVTLVDPHLPPEWNRRIIRVLDSPARLEPGTEWVVEMSALGRRWPSRSQAQLLGASARRFEYTSRTDDGNPSYTVWSRTVSGTERGGRVPVSWELNPKTFWCRALLVRVRQQLFKSEVPTSLAALGAGASWTTAHGG